MANFEAFLYSIKLSANLWFLERAPIVREKLRFFFCLEANWRGFHKTCQRKIHPRPHFEKEQKKLPCVVVFNFEFNEEHEKTKLGPPSGKKNIFKKKVKSKVRGFRISRGIGSTDSVLGLDSIIAFGKSLKFSFGIDKHRFMLVWSSKLFEVHFNMGWSID